MAAADFPASGEGPNENALALTADGAVLSVARMDGGDGKAWGDHRFKPYYASRSAQASRGKVWLGVGRNFRCASLRPVLYSKPLMPWIKRITLDDVLPL